MSNSSPRRPSSGVLLDESGRPVHVQYVLADLAAQIAGAPIASDPNLHMVLYRVDGTLRTQVSISGWYADSWTGPTVDWTRHACSGGALQLPVHSDPLLFAGVTQDDHRDRRREDGGRASALDVGSHDRRPARRSRRSLPRRLRRLAHSPSRRLPGAEQPGHAAARRAHFAAFQYVPPK